MKLFNYILKSFLKFTLGILLLTVFMFVLSDLVENYGRVFERYNATPKEILLYYSYVLPFQIIQNLPFAALIGSVASMMMLNRSGEIIAIRAAGIGALRIAKPIVFGGLLFSALTFYFSDSVVPKLSVKRNHLLAKLKGESASSLVDTKWTRAGEWIYSFSEFDLRSRTLTNVKAFRLSTSKADLLEIWSAPTAKFNEKSNSWQLRDKRRVNFSNGELKSFTKTLKSKVNLPYEPKKLFKDERVPIELSFKELLGFVETLKASGAQFRRYEVSFHVKVGYCFAALLLSILGIKFGFTFERNSAVMKKLLFTIVLGVAYFFVLSSSRALVLSNSLPTWIGGWSANLFMLLVGIIELKKLSKV